MAMSCDPRYRFEFNWRKVTSTSFLGKGLMTDASPGTFPAFNQDTCERLLSLNITVSIRNFSSFRLTH